MWNIPGMVIPGSDMLEGKPGAREIADQSGRLEADSKSTQDEKIFARELGRLKLSLQSMETSPGIRIVMTHFPPTTENGPETAVTTLLEHYKVHMCVFGHLHDLALPPGKTIDFFKSGIRYVLVSADAIGFSPYRLW